MPNIMRGCIPKDKTLLGKETQQSSLGEAQAVQGVLEA